MSIRTSNRSNQTLYMTIHFAVHIVTIFIDLIHGVDSSVADPGRFFSDPDPDPRIWF